MTCEKCLYWYSDCDEFGDRVVCTCHCEGEVAPCEEESHDEKRYSLWYREPLFENDERCNDWHGFDCDEWDDVKSVLNAYGNDVHITVKDNYYDVSYDSFEGEWS